MRHNGSSAKRKVTLYFGVEMLADTQREALRQDRSISWIIQAAWKHAREDVRRLPGVVNVTPTVAVTAPSGASLAFEPRGRITPPRPRRASA